MSDHLSTGSAFGRFLACLAYSVLPRVQAASSSDAVAGHARHGYLERISNGMTPSASLALVAEEHRATCADIDLDVLADDLQLAPEVTLAYHPGNDTARLVGQGLGRDYSDVTFDELPMTLDLVGVDLDLRRGKVKDYKNREAPRIDVNWQIRGGALALARIYDLDEVDGELIFLGMGQRRERTVYTATDFLLAAAEMREGYERALRARAAYARGEHIVPTEGPHCKYCPCAWSCPAKTGLIRAALGGELRTPVDPVEAALLRPRIKEAVRLLGEVDDQIKERAEERPILLGRDEDGTERWLGAVIEDGDEKLDAQVVLPIAARVLGVEEAELFEEAADLKVTKKALKQAISDRVPRGMASATERQILNEARAAGGVTRAPRQVVDIYTVRPEAGEH